MPDSLVAKWLVRPLAIAGAATVNPTGGLPTSVGSTTTVTTPPATSQLAPVKIGMNLNEARYFNPNRVFMNLAADAGWVVQPAGGASSAGYFDANRNVIKYQAGDNIWRAVKVPEGIYLNKSVDVVCRWDGSGTIEVARPPGVKNFVSSANSFRYTVFFTAWDSLYMPAYLRGVDPANPVRNFDCREADADPTALFTPVYLAAVKRYSTVRFMKWQQVEGNQPMTWAERTTPAMGQILGDKDGYPIEHMIALANQAKVNPWFAINWNADDDYIRKFAIMVRDTLDPNLKVYVETSNEVWNWVYSVTTQAANEGLAEGLSTNMGQAMLFRYSERTSQVMDIWSDVFQGQMSRLVRVAASQNSNPWTIQQVLQFGNTKDKIDAVASAPYFAYSLTDYTGPTNDLSSLFAELKNQIDLQYVQSKQWKQTADQYHKRFILYESGQHIVNIPTDKVALLDQIEHDPRMGQLYTYYMTRWANEFGDEMVLFNDYDQSSVFGSWGLNDYVGQAPLATPKSKAVTLFLASINNK